MKNNYIIGILLASLSLSLVAPSLQLLATQEIQPTDQQFNSFYEKISRKAKIAVPEARILWQYGIKKLKRETIDPELQRQFNEILPKTLLSIGAIIVIIAGIIGVTVYGRRKYKEKTEERNRIQQIELEDKFGRAIMVGDTTTVKELFSKENINPNEYVRIKNLGGIIPLFEAVWKQHEGLVKLLLEKGANIITPQGNILEEAVKTGNNKILKTLIDKLATYEDTEKKELYLTWALNKAQQKNNQYAIKLLIDNGAKDLNVKK